MRAVTIVDGELIWAERADPVPGDSEVLVAVRAAGLNAADLLQRRGFYPAPAGVPGDIPGLEVAGEVVAVGPGASRFAPGDRVMGVVGGGAQAEMALIDERGAMAVPDGLSWEEAGGFPEAFSTAYDALFTQCGLAMGDRVLVTAAAGGVGTAAVQLVAATGATAVASVRTAGLRSQVAGLGAVPPSTRTRPSASARSTWRWNWWGDRASRECSAPWPWVGGSPSSAWGAGPGRRSIC